LQNRACRFRLKYFFLSLANQSSLVVIAVDISWFSIDAHGFVIFTFKVLAFLASAQLHKISGWFRRYCAGFCWSEDTAIRWSSKIDLASPDHLGTWCDQRRWWLYRHQKRGGYIEHGKNRLALFLANLFWEPLFQLKSGRGHVAVIMIVRMSLVRTLYTTIIRWHLEDFVWTVKPISCTESVAVPTVAASVRTIVHQLNLHILMTQINHSLQWWENKSTRYAENENYS